MKKVIITQDKERLEYTGNEHFWTNDVWVNDQLFCVNLHMDDSDYNDNVIGSYHCMNDVINAINSICETGSNQYVAEDY